MSRITLFEVFSRRWRRTILRLCNSKSISNGNGIHAFRIASNGNIANCCFLRIDYYFSARFPDFSCFVSHLFGAKIKYAKCRIRFERLENHMSVNWNMSSATKWRCNRMHCAQYVSIGKNDLISHKITVSNK